MGKVLNCNSNLAEFDQLKKEAVLNERIKKNLAKVRI